MDELVILSVIDCGRGFIEVLTTGNKKYRRQSGTVSWRCNNPGNLKYGKFTSALCAVGKDHIGHAVFPTYDFGKIAQYMLLFSQQSVYYKMTLTDAICRYAPTSDGNDPIKYASFLAHSIGITTETKLSSLSSSQRSDLIEAMKTFEGYKQGQIVEVT